MITFWWIYKTEGKISIYLIIFVVLYQSLLPNVTECFYCLPHARPINQEMRCWGKEQWLYLESHQAKKTAQRTILTSQNPGLFYTKGGGGILANFLVQTPCSCSCPHVMQCFKNLKQHNHYFLFSSFLPLLWRGKCYEMSEPWGGLSCIFQLIGNSCFRKAQSQHDSAQSSMLGVRKQIRHGVRFVLCYT